LQKYICKLPIPAAAQRDSFDGFLRRPDQRALLFQQGGPGDALPEAKTHMLIRSPHQCPFNPLNPAGSKQKLSGHLA
jgi:hypothetical protein